MKGINKMKELLFFIVGMVAGGLLMTMVMSFIQINRINELDAKYKN